MLHPAFEGSGKISHKSVFEVQRFSRRQLVEMLGGEVFKTEKTHQITRKEHS